jgi:hypothetical protein
MVQGHNYCPNIDVVSQQQYGPKAQVGTSQTYLPYEQTIEQI